MLLQGLRRGRKHPGFPVSWAFQSPGSASSGFNTAVNQLTKESGKRPEESSPYDRGQNRGEEMNRRANMPGPAQE